jgi:hypothetical protein
MTSYFHFSNAFDVTNIFPYALHFVTLYTIAFYVWKMFLLWNFVCILTTPINSTSAVSGFEKRTPCPDKTGTKQCCKENEGCDNNAYFCVHPASEKNGF